ncbi:hypothetical protein ACFLYP_01625 [Chloroflexota bacterium]
MVVKDTDITNAVQQQTEHNRPIVLTLKKKKKKKGKRRYSKGLEEMQRMERHLTRSTHRMASAAEKGISSYRKSSIKSARKKRDGAIRDFIPNSGTAVSRALEEASPIPYDIARAMDTPQNRKRLRRQLRAISRALRAWRW